MIEVPTESLIGTHDIILITLDTLRYDVAVRCARAGRTPELVGVLPGGVWEQRHSPGSFTYAAHHAFFAGFLPTPLGTGPHPRLFAPAFPGSESLTERTWVFDEADLPAALAARGYHTLCVGGVGFFNPASALGRVLPERFHERHWDPSLGVTSPRSTELQVDRCLGALGGLTTRAFLFLNVSALHQPNCLFTPGATVDSLDTMAAALAYVDRHLGRLFAGLRARGPALVIITSDHGTAYGEDGYHGHRLAHPVVWTVPYAELLLT